jgi:hypothetical protein
MELDCQTLEQTLRELDECVDETVPLLALGQTVFWDEPMKAGLISVLQRMGSSRKLIAGVHDTDYFAKLPSGKREPGKFKSLPHNDTTTRGLWSAAAEFSALFGSETVIRRHDFIEFGAQLEKVLKARPQILDEVTQAYGWRGVVSLADDPPITAELALASVFQELQSTLDWAINESIGDLSRDCRDRAQAKVDELWTIVCDTFSETEHGSLAEFYRALLPKMYAFVAGQPVDLETAVSTELFRFNVETCSRPRFELVGLFLDPETRQRAEQAYNAALAGAEIYDLERFGTGALPFDLVIPGLGRGTLRLGKRGIVINARKPQFISLRQPVTCVTELAEVIERKFGPNCALIGKAVSLIGMLSREFVFVFHEGASGYVKHTRAFHSNLEHEGLGLGWHPILRVRYSPWDALAQTDTWLSLPKPMHMAFGAEDICGPSFAQRWRSVAKSQEELLSQIRTLQRPVDLIEFLDKHVGGAWSNLSEEYRRLQRSIEANMTSMADLRAKRHALYGELRQWRANRVQAEVEKGRHWRERIFEKTPTPEDEAERKRLTDAVTHAIHEVARVKNAIHGLLHEQSEIASAPAVLSIHERRRAIELEAELQRIKLIRQAVITSKGLVRAGQRPSAWWFPLLSPDGRWFDQTIRSAEAYLEPLSSCAHQRAHAAI